VHRCYGKLQHGDVSLPFCLTSRPFPTEGQEVLLSGVLGVNKNLAVELQGEVAGAWQSTAIKLEIEMPSRTRPVVLLSQFIAQNALGALGFLTTKTGWDDICGAAQLPEIRHCPQKQASFVNETDFLGGVEQLLAQGVAGIVVARGGGEKLGVIGDSEVVTRALIETGVPFYTALGHATDLGLLDKHADQSFLTPTDLAHRLCAHVEAERAAGDDREAAKNAERKRIEALAIVGAQDQTIHELKKDLGELKVRIAQFEAGALEHAKVRRWLLAALFVIALVAAVAVIH